MMMRRIEWVALVAALLAALQVAALGAPGQSAAALGFAVADSQEMTAQGVTLGQLAAMILTEFGVTEQTGVWVSEVVPGSPAEAAGLVAGDIIYRVGDQPPGQLEQAAMAAQGTLQLTVANPERQGNPLAVLEIKLPEGQAPAAAQPQAGGNAGAPQQPAGQGTAAQAPAYGFPGAWMMWGYPGAVPGMQQGAPMGQAQGQNWNAPGAGWGNQGAQPGWGQPAQPGQPVQPGWGQPAQPGQPVQPGVGQAGQPPTFGAGELGDPLWGFKFPLPQGWKANKTADGAMLGHDQIAGVILVLWHVQGSLQQLQQHMMQPVQEEGLRLQLVGNLQQMSQNVLAGEYAGVAEGAQVQAIGYGTLSPHGGGGLVAALSTPQAFTRQLSDAAYSIAQGMQYFPVQTGDAATALAGKWIRASVNTEGYVLLSPDGSYQESNVSFFSGQLRDGWTGEQTGAWQAGGQPNQTTGRWTVRGDKTQGQIIVTMANGEQKTISYKVQMENGQAFWNEYWFGGTLYSRG